MKNTMEYKGYLGSVEFDEEEGLLFGRVMGIRSLISYEGESAKELLEDFHGAVDDYLELCRAEGKTPETAYKGSFNVRISPELHKQLAVYAMEHDVSLNHCVEQALEKDDKTALDYAVKRDLLLHTAMAFLQGFPMLNCGDEIAQLNGWDYKNDPDRVEDSRNLHRSKFNWEDAKQRTRKGTLQNKLWQGMEQLRQMRADPCFAPDAWVTTWDSHNPGVLALVRKRGEETLVGLFNFTEYPAGASLDALGGKYKTADGKPIWLADVELKPYQALLVKNK